MDVSPSFCIFMTKKNKSKKNFLLDACVPAIAYLAAKIVPLLPLPLVRLIGHCLFLFLYPIALATGLRKRFAINISTSFEIKSNDSDVNKIARQTLHNWVMNIAEIFYFWHPKNRKKLIQYVRIEGLEKINRMKKNGLGVVGVSPHFGNFPLMIFRLNIEDINMSYLFKEVEQPSIASMMRGYLKRLELNVILTNNQSSPTRKAVNQINHSGFVIFIADEFKKSGGTEVNFFGKPTAQAIGPSYVALETGAPILPLFIIREKKNRHRIIINDPIIYKRSGSRDDDIRQLTQDRMFIFEQYIRKYPDLWLWVHSRWIDTMETKIKREAFRGPKEHIN